MWHDMYGDGHFWGMHLIWWAIWIILIIVIFFIPWSFGRESPGDSALDVLRERYARGEIDKDEFEERKRVLEGK